MTAGKSIANIKLASDFTANSGMGAKCTCWGRHRQTTGLIIFCCLPNSASILPRVMTYHIRLFTFLLCSVINLRFEYLVYHNLSQNPHTIINVREKFSPGPGFELSSPHYAKARFKLHHPNESLSQANFLPLLDSQDPSDTSVICRYER